MSGGAGAGLGGAATSAAARPPIFLTATMPPTSRATPASAATRRPGRAPASRPADRSPRQTVATFGRRSKPPVVSAAVSASSSAVRKAVAVANRCSRVFSSDCMIACSSGSGTSTDGLTSQIARRARATGASR